MPEVHFSKVNASTNVLERVSEATRAASIDKRPTQAETWYCNSVVRTAVYGGCFMCILCRNRRTAEIHQTWTHHFGRFYTVAFTAHVLGGSSADADKQDSVAAVASDFCSLPLQRIRY